MIIRLFSVMFAVWNGEISAKVVKIFFIVAVYASFLGISV